MVRFLMEPGESLSTAVLYNVLHVDLEESQAQNVKPNITPRSRERLLEGMKQNCWVEKSVALLAGKEG